MVFKMVAVIPVYLHLPLCINTPTVAQTFRIWKTLLLTLTSMEDDPEYPKNRPQEYRLHSYHTRQDISDERTST